MTGDTHTQPTGAARQMDSTRKIGLAGGVRYLITFAPTLLTHN